jgi:glycosidase
MDFMGGWPGDPLNKFTEAGRTPKEDSIFNYTKSLANFRKSSSALKTGKLMQFTPDEGLYTYFRYDGSQTIMVVMNTAREERVMQLNRFAERTKGFTKAMAIGVSEGGTQTLGTTWKVPPATIWIMELQ